MNLRYVVAAAAVALCGTVLVGVAAQGHSTTVQVHDYMFMASKVTVGVGQAVTWDFPDSRGHTTTSNQGFWKSPTESNGDSYPHTFASAGSYPYICSIHPDMTAVVTVPMTVTGTPKAGYKLIWSAKVHRSTVDVQMQQPGSKKWVVFTTGSSATGGTFNPKKAGTYVVRARAHEGAHTSSWTPSRSLNIS